MDLLVKIFLERADNELMAAKSLKKLSEELNQKQEFNIPKDITFYSSVISHSYYSIFYAAKALLLKKGIKTESPNVHTQTYLLFKKEFVDAGILDLKLLELYKNIVMKADVLLEIFMVEKWKRGNFTYKTIPQANKEPAEDSLKNANIFVANINKIVNNSKSH